MKETKFKQTLVQTKEGSRHCEERSDVAIQSGFKMTEVGLIPNDWDVAKLGNFVKKIDAGVSVNSDESIYSDNYVLKTSAIHNGVINYKEVKAVIKKDIHRLKCPLKEDCLIVSRMNTPDLVGECAYSEKDVDNIFLPDRLWLVPNEFKNKISFKLINYVLNTPIMRNAIKGTATGTSNSMKNISKGKFLSIECAFPPTIEEQQRIANALSDVDTLIANLEKLIAKKKNIKQGAMQQLLSGKKRLPGFGLDERTGSRPTDERRKECHSERSAKREVEESSGYKMTELGMIPTDWEVKNLADLGYFFSGSGFPLKYQGRVDGKYPFYKVSDFNNVGNDFSMNIANNYVSEQIARKLGCKIIPKNAILFAKIGAAIMLERKKICTRACCADNNMMAFICYDFCDAAFMNAVLAMIKFADYSASSALPSLSSRTLGTIQIAVPHSKAEQTAIANVLSDMDTEISVLETKLAKYRTLKTGMMQQLLIGKIRLV